MEYSVKACLRCMDMAIAVIWIWLLLFYGNVISEPIPEDALARGDCHSAAEYPEIERFPGHTSTSLSKGAHPKMWAPLAPQISFRSLLTLSGTPVGFQRPTPLGARLPDV